MTIFPSPSRFLATSVLLALTPPFGESFMMSQQQQPTTRTPSPLFSTIDRREVDDDHNLERTRAALEDLMNSMQESSKSKGRDRQQKQQAKARNILTTAGRHRRQLEMDLLRQLYSMDDRVDQDDVVLGEEPVENTDQSSGDDDNEDNTALDELMHLWMYEHDPESAMQLEAMQESCSPGMVVEEGQLRQMCVNFPTWAEPRARLAILLFMKGISQEAKEFAQQALELKPWHFEVYPILVMLALREENMAQALYWARKSLPTERPWSSGNCRRRKAWVDQALENAARMWEDAERDTLELGKGSTSNLNCLDENDDECLLDLDDTWQ